MKYQGTYSLVIFYLLTSFFYLNSQNTDTEKIGGSNQKNTEYEKTKEKIKLDEALFCMSYQFKYGLVNNKNLSLNTDTMTLVLGARYSIYFDRNDKNRRETFSSYLTHQGAPKAFISTAYDEFTEIAVNDNYLFTPSTSGETSQLYKDRKKNVVTVMDFDNSNFGADELYFFYEEEKVPISWIIKEDTMSVLGHLCTKAICDFGGRKYTAWFTQDIPINDGPYKFYGLPGMILRIEDSEKLFQFKAIGLENMENAEIVIDDKSTYLKCTKEEYHIIKKRMQENYTVYYRDGMLLHFSYRKTGVEYMPIEKMGRVGRIDLYRKNVR